MNTRPVGMNVLNKMATQIKHPAKMAFISPPSILLSEIWRTSSSPSPPSYWEIKHGCRYLDFSVCKERARGYSEKREDGGPVLIPAFYSKLSHVWS